MSRARAKLIGFITSLVVAATPGAYSAWQSARNEWRAGVEARKTDVQEENLRVNVEALSKAVRALESGCVSQGDVLDLVVKLRGLSDPWTRRRDRPRRTQRKRELEREIQELRGRAVRAAKVWSAARRARAKAPKLRAPDAVRRMVQRAAE